MSFPKMKWYPFYSGNCLDTRRLSQIIGIIILSQFIIDTMAFSFKLLPDHPRCLSDNVQAHVFMNGKYNVTVLPESDLYLDVTLKITDSKDQVVYTKSPATQGKFGFIVDKDDKFTICIESRFPASDRNSYSDVRPNFKERSTRHVELNVVSTMSFESRREQRTLDWMLLNMTNLDKELLLLQEFSGMLVYQLNEHAANQEAIRVANDHTGNLFLYVSTFGLVVLIGLCFWQVIYLRNYFRAKKIIS